MHVAFGLVGPQRVKRLLLTGSAQRGNGQHLRLAAGEEARAVRTGQHADLGPDGPEGGGVATVGANALVEDAPPHRVFKLLFEDLGHVRWGDGLVLGKALDDLLT